MNSNNILINPEGDSLFHRIASILEQARGNVVRSINSNMVLAYWMIGREIVLELQGGEERAEYGKQVLENLSARLTKQYGTGFSVANLKNFRQFFLMYPDRLDVIRYPAGSELSMIEKRYPTGSESLQGFSPLLSWSHYRALMRVQDAEARAFYEQEIFDCGWNKAQLERQIQSSSAQ